jgi:hypothetical protein
MDRWADRARLLIVGCAVALLVGSAGIAVATMFDGLDELPAGFAPGLATIAADKPVHFVKRDKGCPNATPACEARTYLVRGDSVVVITGKGDYVDVGFTGGAPAFRSTRGWLPRSAVAPVPTPVPGATPPSWIGSWRNGTDSIEIKRAANGRLEISGTATWGGDDPKRVAAGGVNVGDFDTSVPPPGGMVTFSPNLDGDGAPATLDPPLDGDACALRMWLLDPYLVVADNARCGGANVTFSNLYRRSAAK